MDKPWLSTAMSRYGAVKSSTPGALVTFRKVKLMCTTHLYGLVNQNNSSMNKYISVSTYSINHKLREYKVLKTLWLQIKTESLSLQRLPLSLKNPVSCPWNTEVRTFFQDLLQDQSLMTRRRKSETCGSLGGSWRAAHKQSWHSRWKTRTTSSHSDNGIHRRSWWHLMKTTAVQRRELVPSSAYATISWRNISKSKSKTLLMKSNLA